MIKLFPDGKIWTIPNYLSFFRLILVPFIVWSYMGLHNTTLCILLLVLSALSDILDGQIARRCNLVSDLGKVLDPVADKLTQICIVLCLAFTYPLLWVLLGLCLLRETCMGILGFLTIQKTGKVTGARWYGKVSTVVLYASALSMLLFENMSHKVATLLIALCIVCVAATLVLYTRFHMSCWKQADESKRAAS
ncbi:MAG: CDP-alcohol phosphatidyltransferase family protein [Treponema sp.]|nr:CDP-alcohol phosphatidyltransferase family protein [Treponema sp.]